VLERISISGGNFLGRSLEERKGYRGWVTDLHDDIEKKVAILTEEL